MDLLAELRQHRFMAIVRGTDARASRSVVRRLIDLEVPLVEVSLTSTDAAGVLRDALTYAINTGTIVGAGTVVTSADAREASDAGAAFLVTPTTGSGFAEAVRIGVPVLAGALTPTEIAEAWAKGATAVKLFPISAVPSNYLAAVREPLPAIPIVPVGGVDPDSARRLLAAGAIAVGIGTPLLGDAPHGGPLDQVDARVATFRAAVEAR